MKIRKSIARPCVWLALLVGGSGIVLVWCGAKGQAQPATVRRMMQAASALERDPALAVKVSLEAKRLLLRELLVELQRQSGVTLAASEQSPAATARVTMRVKDMPLSTFMNALSRLYGVEWTKNAGGEYVMRSEARGEMLAKVLRVSARAMHTTPQEGEEQRRQKTALADEIVRPLDVNALKSPAGVPIAALPEALRQKLRRHIEGRSVDELLGMSVVADEVLAQDLSLHFTASAGAEQGFITSKLTATHIPRKWDLEPGLHLTVRAPDGNLIASVFPFFPSKKDLEREQREQGRR